jgi:hypothetical protein
VFNETDKQPKEETPPSRPLPTPKEVISTQNLSTIISNFEKSILRGKKHSNNSAFIEDLSRPCQ